MTKTKAGKNFSGFLLRNKEFKTAIRLYEDKVAKNEKLISNTKIKIAKYAEKEIIINEFKFYAAKNGNLVINRFHNALDKFNLTEYEKPFDKDRYVENEKVKTIVYNIPENITVLYKDSIYEIKEKELFTEYAGDFLKDFNDFMTGQYVKNLTNAPGGAIAAATITNMATIINDFIKNYAAIKWLSEQSAPLAFPELKTYGPKFRSEEFTATEKKDPSYVVQYTLTSQKDNADKILSKNTFKYTVYKRQFFQFSAGVAFTPNKEFKHFNNERIQSNYRNDTFSSTTLKPYDIVAGVKIYPFGLNVRRWFPVIKSKGNKRGDLMINRISLFAGLSISQAQLRNYFVGGGFEFVPGLGFNIGSNFYTTKTYKFENGTLIKEKEIFRKPSLYFAITVDPIVLFQVTNIIKIK